MDIRGYNFFIGNFKGEGIFERYQWENDAKGYLFSSKTLRNYSLEKTIELKRLQDAIRHKEIVANIVEREYLNKSSLLLLGFGIELVLKSGVLALYRGVSKDIFKNDIKTKYSHKLADLAKDLFLDLTKEEISLLMKMKVFIEKEIKYPLEISNDEEYIKKYNQRANEIWDDNKYSVWVELYNKIKCQIRGIDHCEEDAMHGGYWQISTDEYIHYRRGGKLPPIIIIKDSIKRDKKTEELKSFILQHIDESPYRIYIEKDWDITILYQVNSNKLSLQKIS